MDPRKDNYIGKRIKVVKANNSAIIGIEGLIIDESKNSFKIETSKGVKTILKKGAIFMINGKKIKGDHILKRPEDRIGMKIKKIKELSDTRIAM